MINVRIFIKKTTQKVTAMFMLYFVYKLYFIDDGNIMYNLKSNLNQNMQWDKLYQNHIYLRRF